MYEYEGRLIVILPPALYNDLVENGRKVAMKLSNQERRDLIRALQDAQAEVCNVPEFPDDMAQWERWERLIGRLQSETK